MRLTKAEQEARIAEYRATAMETQARYAEERVAKAHADKAYQREVAESRARYLMGKKARQ